MGRVQLRKVPGWVARRRRLAGELNASFRKLPGLRVTTPGPDCVHAYYKYYAFVRPEALRYGWDRDRIVAEIMARGVQCFQGSCSEVYLEKAFPTEWRPVRRLPVARELGETSLMFLVHPTLTDEYISKTCEVVSLVMNAATR